MGGSRSFRRRSCAAPQVWLSLPSHTRARCIPFCTSIATYTYKPVLVLFIFLPKWGYPIPSLLHRYMHILCTFYMEEEEKESKRIYTTNTIPLSLVTCFLLLAQSTNTRFRNLMRLILNWSIMDRFTVTYT